MDILTFALREWRRRIASPRLWAIWAITSGLFAVAMPFGAAGAYGPADRMLYWLVALGGAWAVSTLIGSGVEAAMRPSGASALSTLVITVAASAPFVALILGGLRALALGTPYGFGAWFAALPVYAALTLLLEAKSRLVMGRPMGLPALDRSPPASAQDGLAYHAPGEAMRSSTPPVAPPEAQEPSLAPPARVATKSEADWIAPTKTTPTPTAASAPPTAAAPARISRAAPTARADIASGPPLLRRLPADKRGALLRLTMNDHYVSVATDGGEEMLLMRLGDAMDEAWPEEGLRVHRSHWVARRAVREVRRDGDRAALTLVNGEEIPVSRARLRDLREAGWMDDGRTRLGRRPSAPRSVSQPPPQSASSGEARRKAHGHAQAAAMANPPDRVTGRARDARSGRE
ncbi:LytTr DNA-binding domain-containing protein [Albimonas donghaensis]|uniref:LytTr DNA-binding domain-containing protein n=1 Tax=Albimonas donghaensis TaxID=356660 RepID=A0A1H2RMA6_9RHOB|nr:LytTR family DNA-binding domain-containing protein [Albimonas donghaensis]SDW20623.1 LytTr DNA-binding domain-containing protein [Albimonas donghaensis]